MSEADEPEVVEVGVGQAITHARFDDGTLRPRARDEVFAGAPRGSLPSIDELAALNRENLLGLRGIMLLGAAAFMLLCTWLAFQGVRAGGHGFWPSLRTALCILLVAAVPVAMRIVLRRQAESEFWWRWFGTRGFDACEPSTLPESAARSPLLGPESERVIAALGRGPLAGRTAFLGALLHVIEDPGERPKRAPTIWQSTFIVMPLSPRAAARWPGASIRADHHAHRPGALRAMLGPLVSTNGAGTRAHIAAAPDQDSGITAEMLDSRLDEYLARHPLDADMVGGVLVVSRDGLAGTSDDLEALCRDAQVLHALLVTEQESARPDDDAGADGDIAQAA